VSKSIKCPKCETNFKATLSCLIGETEKIELCLTRKDGNENWDALTIGNSIVNMAKALKATAKSLDQKAEVYLENVEITQQTMSAMFFVVPVKPRAPTGGPDTTRGEG
jgi:hypothetical protein